MFSKPRRSDSSRAALTMPAVGSVNITWPEGPTTRAIVNDGSPAPPPISSTDWPATICASSISARVNGAYIFSINAWCLFQYCEDVSHAASTWSASSLAILFRFQRKAGLFPSLKSAKQRMNILITVGREFLRHPGAGVFVRSSTVGDYCAVMRNFRQMFFNFVSGHPHRAGQLGFGFAPSYRIARVDKSKLLAAIHPFFHFINCDSCYFHLRPSFRSLGTVRP